MFFSPNLIADEKEIYATRQIEKINLKSEMKNIEIRGADKDGEGEKYLNQYVGKEVIVRGIGEVVNEKNDKCGKVRTTNLSKFVSIELKKGLRIGDRKSLTKQGNKKAYLCYTKIDQQIR